MGPTMVRDESRSALRSRCIPFTALPGASALFADYLYDFARVAPFYAHNPHEPESMRRAAAAAAAAIPDERRRAVVAALRKINGESHALDALELPGTVAVVTGQQVGLFGGPAYTLYKALTAAKLARQLTEKGVRTVPVFWLATEDHDLDEADHCWLFGTAHRPERLQARVRGAAGAPVGRMELDAVPVEELRATLVGFAEGEEIAERVAAAYTPGRTMGEAFRVLLADLLRGYGLVFLDPLDPDLRAIAAPILAESLTRSDELGVKLVARGAELKAAGYHSQVLIEPDTSLLMRFDAGRRAALKRRDGAFFQGQRRFSVEELAAEPALLSPNALLRPVMEDYLLPTAADIGGPAEIAYFAQSETLYRALLGRMPVAVPRASFTLVDKRARGLMERFDLTLTDCLQPEAILRARIAAKLVPDSLQRQLQESAAEAAEAAARAERALEAYDPTLGPAMRKSAAKIAWQFEKNRGKAAREALRRERQADAGAGHLSGLLYPERHMQERLYSFLPFLAEHGLELIDTLYAHTYRGCADHLELTV